MYMDCPRTLIFAELENEQVIEEMVSLKYREINGKIIYIYIM